MPPSLACLALGKILFTTLHSREGHRKLEGVFSLQGTQVTEKGFEPTWAGPCASSMDSALRREAPYILAYFKAVDFADNQGKAGKLTESRNGKFRFWVTLTQKFPISGIHDSLPIRTQRNHHHSACGSSFFPPWPSNPLLLLACESSPSERDHCPPDAASLLRFWVFCDAS